MESDFLSLRNEIAEILSHDLPTNLDVVLNLALRLSEDGEGIPLFLEFLEVWYRDLLLIKEGLSDMSIYNRDIIAYLHLASKHETYDNILKKIKKVKWMQNNAGLNIDKQLGLESIFMQH
jgi:hypothetical protein